MHVYLIEASRAFFLGHRTEMMEWLEQLPKSERESVFAQWLAAQSSYKYEERTVALEKFTETFKEKGRQDNEVKYYLTLTQNMLESDQIFEEGQAIPKRRRWVPVMRNIVILAIVGFAIYGVVQFTVTLFSGSADVANGTVSNPQSVETTDAAIQLPENIERLSEAQSRSVTYANGRLEVVAIERDSQRVVDRNNFLVSPVEGARFFALELRFECLSGVCENPPQATLAVRVNDDIEPVLPNLRIALTQPLDPIGAGFSTSGWVVFQVAESEVVSTLLVDTGEADQGTLNINLPQP